jgi:hypothetical protein
VLILAACRTLVSDRLLKEFGGPKSDKLPALNQSPAIVIRSISMEPH